MPPQGWKFGIAVNDGEKIVGVVTIGRPVARNLDDGWTLEVTRCCTDRTKNAASMLYGAAWRAVRAMGYKRLITYTLNSESGVSLIASGYKVVGQTKEGDTWNRVSRPRIDKHPLQGKLRWEICALIICLIFPLTACLPSAPDPVVIERSCPMEPLPEKSKLPAVQYKRVELEGIPYLCLDPANQEAEKERELRLRQDARVCRESYSRARNRCVGE